MNTDTVDFFRAREALAWKQFLVTGAVEDLHVWRGALSALNGELQARTRMLLARGRAHFTPAVQTSGEEPSDAE